MPATAKMLPTARAEMLAKVERPTKLRWEFTSSRAPKTVGKVNNRRNASNMQGTRTSSNINKRQHQNKHHQRYKQQQTHQHQNKHQQGYKQQQTHSSASEQETTWIQATADTSASEQASQGYKQQQTHQHQNKNQQGYNQQQTHQHQKKHQQGYDHMIMSVCLAA
jgi:hypothetical protein